jgi:hypothetical protein
VSAAHFARRQFARHLARYEGLAWAAVATALALPAGLIGVVGFDSILAMHPAQGWAHNPPTRWVSAAWAHASPPHLQANLLGCGLLAVLGWLAQTRAREALAWLLAWPLANGLLLLDPRLPAFMGASGVLHAGIAVLAVHLLLKGRKALGMAVLVGLFIKVGFDLSHGLPTYPHPTLGIDVSPLSHLTGTLAGLFFAGILGALRPQND